MDEPVKNSSSNQDLSPTHTQVGFPDIHTATAIQLAPSTHQDLHHRPSIPGYEFGAILGRGGMGIVYKAVQQSLNREVAVKMILGDVGGDSKEIIRFLAEAETVASVRHPHVVQVFESGQVANRPYLVLEFCSGGTLSQRLKSVTRLTPRETAEILQKVANAVQAAHYAGVVHRDLKPGNVLFDEHNQPKVADFGLAKRGVGSDLTRTVAVMGTPAYMAPEQADGRAKFAGPAADVWALGIMIYECLTGERPFQAEEPWELLQKVREQTPKTPRQVWAAVPIDLELICLKCLSKEPHERYPTAGPLAEDLRRWLQGEPISVRPVSPLTKAWKWSKRNRPLAISLTTVVAASLTGTIVSTHFAIQASRREQEAIDNLRRAEDAEKKANDQARVVAQLAQEVANLQNRVDQLKNLPPISGMNDDQIKQLKIELDQKVAELAAKNSQIQNDVNNTTRQSVEVQRAPKTESVPSNVQQIVPSQTIKPVVTEPTTGVNSSSLDKIQKGIQTLPLLPDRQQRSVEAARLAGDLVRELEQSYDQVKHDGGVTKPVLSKDEKDNLVRTIGKQLKELTSNSGMNEAAQARITLARTRYLAEFSPLNKNDVAEGWSESKEALDRLGNVATADDFGYVALLTYATFYFDHVDGKIPAAGKPIPENLADRWAKLFIWVDQALAKDPSNSPANRALASAYAFLNSYPGMYRPIHEKATELARVVGKYDPADLSKEIVKRYTTGLDSTSRHLPDLQYYVADLHFRATARAMIAGELTPQEANTRFESVLNRLKKAEQQGYSNRAAVLRIRSAALEDQAWQTPMAAGADFGQALKAYKELETLSAAAYTNDKTTDNWVMWLSDLTSLGRCQYRAAAFGGENRFRASDAVSTLTSALRGWKKLQAEAPKDVYANGYLAEATYFLGMAYWADGQIANANSTLKDASNVAGSGTAAAYRALAIIDRARLLRRMAKSDPSDPAFVKTIRELRDRYGDKTALYPSFIDALANASDGKENQAADQLLDIVKQIEKSSRTDAKRRSNEVYQYALLELHDLWRQGFLLGNSTAAYRAAKLEELKIAMRDFPWRLTSAEKQRVLNDPIK